jgi:hypothetical protein
MSTATLAILVSAVAIAGLVVLLAVWLRARRVQAMRTFAAAHGLSYMGKTWVLGDCDFSLFRKGYRRSWSNVLSGTWNGVTLVYADYEFTERSGRSSQTYVYSTVVTDLGCVLPEVEVTARSVIGELAEQLGVHGLEFESEEFNRRFVVHSDDQRFAFELVDARMIEVLLGGPHDLHVHFGPNRMIVWGPRRSPTDLQPILDAAAALDQRVPVVVRHDYGVAASAAPGG